MSIDYRTLNHSHVKYTSADGTFTMTSPDRSSLVGHSIVHVKSTVDDKKNPLFLIAYRLSTEADQATMPTPEAQFLRRFLTAFIVATVVGRLADFLNALSNALGDAASLPIKATEMLVIWNDTEMDWSPGTQLQPPANDVPITLEAAATASIFHIVHECFVVKNESLMKVLYEMCEYQAALSNAAFERIRSELRQQNLRVVPSTSLENTDDPEN